MMSRTEHGPACAQEIDLIQLLRTLWQGRRLIAGVMLTVVAVALPAGRLWPYTWSSSATVVAPLTQDVMPLSPLLIQMRAAGITPEVDGKWLYGAFLRTWSSGDNLRAWLQETPAYREQVAQWPPEKTEAVLQQMAQGVTLTDSRLDKKQTQPLNWLTLTVRGRSAEEAQTLLTGYMAAVTAQVRREAQAVLAAQVRDALQSAQAQYARALDEQRNALAVKKNRLAYALALARAARIRSPVFSRGEVFRDDPDFAVQLGEAGLEKKLAIIAGLSGPDELNADLLNRRRVLGQLKALKVTLPAVMPYHVLSRPLLPLRHDGPGAGLILALAVLAGLMAGSGVVVLRAALAQTHPLTDRALLPAGRAGQEKIT